MSTSVPTYETSPNYALKTISYWGIIPFLDLFAAYGNKNAWNSWLVDYNAYYDYSLNWEDFG